MPGTYRVYTQRPPSPPADVLEELAGYEVAWLSDATKLNLMDPGIVPVHGSRRVVGPAVTVKVAPGDFGLIAWAMKLAREGDVIVIDARGATSRAVFGDTAAAWAQQLGVQGIVVDGAVRDRSGIADLDFQMYARAVTPAGPTQDTPSEVNVPVSCGGVAVLPGDIVVADSEGAIVLPLRHLSDILESVRQKAATMREMTKPAGGRQGFDAYFEQSWADLHEVEVVDGSWDSKG